MGDRDEYSRSNRTSYTLVVAARLAWNSHTYFYAPSSPSLPSLPSELSRFANLDNRERTATNSLFVALLVDQCADSLQYLQSIIDALQKPES